MTDRIESGAAVIRVDDARPARPLVSIMIPTYNQAAILGKAIESALSQTYPHIEVVVADDASPDSTPETVAAFGEDVRLRYVRRPFNLGRTSNYKTTLTHDVRGEYVLNLDGDDWLCDDEYVADAVEMICANDDLAMVFARSKTYLQESNAYRDGTANEGLPVICDGTSLFLRYPDGDVGIPHMTALYRRDLAIEIGFYSYDIVGSDSVSLLQMLPGRQVGFLDRIVGVWRYHESNATWSSDLASRRANFAVADIPTHSLWVTPILDTGTLSRWRRRMGACLGHQALADSIAAGRIGTAAVLVMTMFAERPGAAVGALTRLVSSGRRRVFNSIRAWPR